RELPAEDAAAYVERSLSTRPWRHEARVTVHAPADVVRRGIPGQWATVTPAGDDTCELRTGDDDIRWLALRVSMLPHEFVVHEPPELVEELRRHVGRLQRACGDA